MAAGVFPRRRQSNNMGQWHAKPNYGDSNAMNDKPYWSMSLAGPTEDERRATTLWKTAWKRGRDTSPSTLTAPHTAVWTCVSCVPFVWSNTVRCSARGNYLRSLMGQLWTFDTHPSFCYGYILGLCCDFCTPLSKQKKATSCSMELPVITSFIGSAR